MTPDVVVKFWRDAGPKAWFAKSDAFDSQIRDRFEPWHHAAARRELDGWTARAEGSLGLLLLLDQFPRNLFRNSAHAYATDPLARHFAGLALAAGHDREVELGLRNFFYLPFMHSEAMADQDRAAVLSEGLARDMDDPGQTKWARLHRDIIVRFGRFPHRNISLGRETTEIEREFLQSGGFAG